MFYFVWGKQEKHKKKCTTYHGSCFFYRILHVNTNHIVYLFFSFSARKTAWETSNQTNMYMSNLVQCLWTQQSTKCSSHSIFYWGTPAKYKHWFVYVCRKVVHNLKLNLQYYVINYRFIKEWGNKIHVKFKMTTWDRKLQFLLIISKTQNLSM